MNQVQSLLETLKSYCFICAEVSNNLQTFNHNGYYHCFCLRCIKNYIDKILGTKVNKFMNISLVFPEVIACPVPMCRFNLDQYLIQSLFQEEFSKAMVMNKLTNNFQYFKKSNFIVGSYTCINDKHQFPNKTFKLEVGLMKSSFKHNCDYCPSCYAFYWQCLQHYERINKSKKTSEETTECLYCGMYLPSQCFENGFDDTRLYRYTQECQNYRDYLLNRNYQKCCELSCLEYENLYKLSDCCMLCDIHLKELSNKIEYYENDKSVIICKNHVLPYDHDILKEIFPNFSDTKEVNYVTRITRIKNNKPATTSVSCICILDNTHEAKIVKNRNKIYIKCDECVKKICCFCAIIMEDDPHECGEEGEYVNEYFENNGFYRCFICNLFTFTTSEFLNCSDCLNEFCKTCGVPKYLVNAHGTCMHRCELHNSSSNDSNYNKNCFACNNFGESCFNQFYGTENQFIYINNQRILK